MRTLRLTLILLSLLYCRVSLAFDQAGLSEPHGSSGTTDKAGMQAAEKHYLEGKAFFNKQKWREALIEFKAAYEFTKAPDMLHNMSLCEEGLGHIPEALEYEEQFFKLNEKDLQQQEKDQTQGRIARLRGQARPKVETGTGQPAIAPVSSQPPEPLTQVPGKRFRPSSLAIGLMAGGAGLVLVGAGCSIGALITSQKVSEGGTYSANDFDALQSRGRTLDRVGIVGETVGGVAVAVGLTVTIVEYVRARRN